MFSSKTSSTRRTRLIGAALAGALALGAANAVLAERADASSGIANRGDILLATQGALFTGAGVDRMDPKTADWSRATSFRGAPYHDLVTVAPDGSWLTHGDSFLRVNPVTGAQTPLPTPSADLSGAYEMAADSSGNLVVLRGTGTYYHPGPVVIDRFNTTTGMVSRLTTGGQLGIGTDSMVVESDGDVLVVSGSRIIRVDATTGAQQSLADYTVSGTLRIALAPSGDLYVAVMGLESGTLDLVNPATGHSTTLASGSYLQEVRGMVLGTDGALYLSSGVDDIFSTAIGRLDLGTGSYRQLRVIGFDDETAMAIAGRTQIPARPVANSEGYGVDEGSVLNVAAATGVLHNDRDGVGGAMTRAVLVTPPHKGELTLHDDGGFRYQPTPFTTGVDSFTYYAIDSHGNRSPLTTTSLWIRSLAPIAWEDSYSVLPGTPLVTGTAAKPGVLANDTIPTGPVSVSADQPAHGKLVFKNDGTFTYAPNAGFSGADSFTYQVYDSVDFSFPTTVSLTVKSAPTVTASGGSLGADGHSASVALHVFDTAGEPADVAMTASSNNQTLLPNSAVKLTGTGATRRLALATVAGRTGKAVVTVTYREGASTRTLPITVVVDDNGDGTITGTPGTEVLFGQGGNDTLDGQAGEDLISGGTGNDTLRGGPGADALRGGAGTDKTPDFSTADGDTRTETE